ncbi:nucleotidyltransferase family protein [Bradyrhizobium sp. McL0615]|uniref:nucleotidyltransferase family protein n=1 Tax=Bradyrhizobium sp. McL0615 TaxID=3415673 RepID=UPI003CEEA915
MVRPRHSPMREVRPTSLYYRPHGLGTERDLRVSDPPAGRTGTKGEEVAGDPVPCLAKRKLSAWGIEHEATAAIWLFGSRARGDHQPHSDFDIALELMPSQGPGKDWAYTAYHFNVARWKSQISTILNNPVDLVCYREDLDCKFDPRNVLIWSRSCLRRLYDKW